MNWADLFFGCWLLWGGIAGYLAGLRRTGSNVAALLGATAVAGAFKSEVRAMLGRSYPLAGYIRKVVTQRLTLAVSSYPAGVDFDHHPFLRELYQRHPALLVNGGAGVDLLCQVILNAICFGLALFLCGAGCYLFVSAWVGSRPLNPLGWGRGAGFLLGVTGAALIATLFIGIALPFLTILPFNLRYIEHSALLQMFWGLVEMLGMWRG